MRIKLFAKVTDEKYKKNILDLLTLCDKEFIPPLSARSSTTQADLSPAEEQGIPTEYFNNIINQNNILAIEDGEVVGFMSFKKNYVCENISVEYTPNLYVTTVIVHPDYRHQGIANKFYDKLMDNFPKHYIFTRTWSTNTGHLRILTMLGFHGHAFLSDDRGVGIDTVYYRYEPKHNTLKQLISQYRLGGNIFFSVILAIISAICIIFWVYSKTDMARELMLAIATSLMASFLCLVSDTYLKIRESKNDSFISKFKDFGIENLHFDKSEVLETLIPKCRDEIWISGYRLIMTSKPPFRSALVLACKRSKNLKMKILCVPPWSEVYKNTYGDDDTTANYMIVFKDLCECVKTQGLKLEVRFVNRTIFNDTYKVDNRFITGPYLNCTDRYKNKITAKDFFTLDVDGKEKKLYKILYDDYMAVWDEAENSLNIEKFTQKTAGIKDFKNLTYEQRLEILLSSLEKI